VLESAGANLGYHLDGWANQCPPKSFPRKDSSQVSSMESCAMSQPKFDINIWGIKISAQGVVGIAAAVVVVIAVLAFYRF
jgi:hypothetical protein